MKWAIGYSLAFCARRSPEDRFPAIVCERAKLLALLIRSGSLVGFTNLVQLGLHCALVERLVLSQAVPDDLRDAHVHNGWKKFSLTLRMGENPFSETAVQYPQPTPVREEFWAEVAAPHQLPSLKTLAERALCSQVTPEELLPALRIADQFDAPLLKNECERVLVQHYHECREFIKRGGGSSRLLLERTLKNVLHRVLLRDRERVASDVELEDSSSDDASDEGEENLHEEMQDVHSLNTRGFLDKLKKTRVAQGGWSFLPLAGAR